MNPKEYPHDHIGYVVDRGLSGSPAKIRYFTKQGKEIQFDLRKDWESIPELVWDDVRGKSRQEKRADSAAFVE